MSTENIYEIFIYRVNTLLILVFLCLLLPAAVVCDCGNTGEDSSKLPNSVYWLVNGNRPIKDNSYPFWFYPSPPPSGYIPNLYASKVCLGGNFVDGPKFMGSELTPTYDFSCAVIDPEALYQMFSNNTSLQLDAGGAASCGCDVPLPPSGQYLTGVDVKIYGTTDFLLSRTYTLKSCTIGGKFSSSRLGVGDKFEQTVSLVSDFSSADHSLVIVNVVFAIVIVLFTAATVVFCIRKRRQGGFVRLR